MDPFKKTYKEKLQTIISNLKHKSNVKDNDIDIFLKKLEKNHKLDIDVLENDKGMLSSIILMYVKNNDKKYLFYINIPDSRNFYNIYTYKYKTSIYNFLGNKDEFINFCNKFLEYDHNEYRVSNDESIKFVGGLKYDKNEYACINELIY